MKKIVDDNNFFDSLVDNIYNFNWLILFCVAISYLYIVSTTFDDYLRKHDGDLFDNTGELKMVGHLVRLCYMLIFTLISYLFINNIKN